MVDMDFNFGGVKASSGFEPFSGRVRARVEEIEVKDTNDKDGVKQETSDGKQAQYLNVKYKVLPDQTAKDADGKEISVGGRVVFGINSIRFPDNPLDDTDKERTTREMFLSWLNVAGGTNFEDHEGGIDFKSFYGTEVDLVCTIGSYEGKPKQNLARVTEPSDDGPLDSLRSRL